MPATSWPITKSKTEIGKRNKRDSGSVWLDGIEWNKQDNGMSRWRNGNSFHSIFLILSVNMIYNFNSICYIVNYN